MISVETQDSDDEIGPSDPLVTCTIIIQTFWTDKSGQTVQTQIGLLLEEQSDLGLHCLPFPLHLLNSVSSQCARGKLSLA